MYQTFSIKYLNGAVKDSGMQWKFININTNNSSSRFSIVQILVQILWLLKDVNKQQK